MKQRQSVDWMCRNYEHPFTDCLCFFIVFTFCLNVKFYIFLGKVIFSHEKVTDIIEKEKGRGT